MHLKKSAPSGIFFIFTISLMLTTGCMSHLTCHDKERVWSGGYVPSDITQTQQAEICDKSDPRNKYIRKIPEAPRRGPGERFVHFGDEGQPAENALDIKCSTR